MEFLSNGAMGSSMDMMRPSILELAAETSVNALIHSATHYTSAVVAQNYPSRLILKLQNNFDEIYLLFNTLIQFMFLKGCSATFTENLYGLKRVSNGSNLKIQRIGSNLSQKDIFKSIFYQIIIFDYLRKKINSLSEVWSVKTSYELSYFIEENYENINKNGIEIKDGSVSSTSSYSQALVSSSSSDEDDNIEESFIPIKSKQDRKKPMDHPGFLVKIKNIISNINNQYNGFKKSLFIILINKNPKLFFKLLLCKLIQPIFENFINFSNSILQISYLLNLTDYYSISLLFSKIILKRLDFNDYQLINKFGPLPSFNPANNNNNNNENDSIGSSIFNQLLMYSSSGLKYGLPVIVFGIRFLEWFYASEYFEKSQIKPIPPPPKLQPPNIKDQCIKLPRDLNICPLCNKLRTNSTQLIKSGYLFCYPCIFKYVDENKKCPITFTPSNITDLRKIYHN